MCLCRSVKKSKMYLLQRRFNRYFENFLKDFIYLFLDRGEGGRKRERNINVWLPLVYHPPGTWPASQACALTGNQIGDHLVHRQVLNPLSHTSQGYFEHFLKKEVAIEVCYLVIGSYYKKNWLKEVENVHICKR